MRGTNVGILGRFVAVLLLATTASFVLVIAPYSAQAEKRVALVIGNSAYGNVPRLPNPANDATAVAALLKSTHFDVVSLQRDLGISKLRRAISDFSVVAADADIAVVYYAGHGIEVNGTNYLIPVDAKLARDFDVEDETVSLDRVLQAIEPAKRLRLVILDACRDNPFDRTMKRSIARRSIGRGLAKVEPAVSDTLVAFAAKAGSTALDGDGDHSPFTSALIRHIATPGLDIRLALGRVRDDVLRTTHRGQEPFVYGSLGGDIVSLVDTPANAAIATTVLPKGRDDESAWAAIKDVLDLNELRRFVKDFPNSARRADADARIAQLLSSRQASLHLLSSRSPRLAIDAPRLRGSVDLGPDGFDDLTVVEAPLNPLLLSPYGGGPNSGYIRLGWLDMPGEHLKLPGFSDDTRWQSQSVAPIGVTHPATLTFDNGHGLLFRRLIWVDDHYLITISDEVVNRTDKQVKLQPFAIIDQALTPTEVHLAAPDEGFVLVLPPDRVRRFPYKSFVSSFSDDTIRGTGGWFGIVRKEWAIVMIADPKDGTSCTFGATNVPATLAPHGYSIECHGGPRTIAPGGKATNVFRLFAGPKQRDVITSYEKQLGFHDFAKLLE